MEESCCRMILNAPSLVPDSPAEIHVLKPRGIKGFVKTSDRFQRPSGDHQTSCRGLIHINGMMDVLQAHPTRPWIRGPQLIEKERVHCRASEVWKAANVESRRWFARRRQKTAAHRPDAGIPG